ncbi:heat shock factor 2-binding protein isoform X5 [Mustela putorius furo]|uniref:Heat shock factor 2-binding protein isoform X5 n=2 Tax=Mustela putorius furo TaxID=9669 RepID=A0A8U0SFG5_MUSPF|nr:heat shock factor 2-binding protein isoform X5 [Mustela putorius furo]
MGEAGGAEEACRVSEEACRRAGAREEFVKVRKKDLERLTTEVMQIRDFLPRILSGDVLESFRRLKIAEKRQRFPGTRRLRFSRASGMPCCSWQSPAFSSPGPRSRTPPLVRTSPERVPPAVSPSGLERKEQEVEQLRTDCAHFRARLEAVQADSMREKKEKLALRQQLNEARQQLLQQAEYCTEMGAAACTLLWGVSSSEDVVKAILGGEKALKFFSITGQTMESFVKSLDGDVKEPDSDENQFVFALAGIVTNVAAIACGREFLVNSSRALLDTVLQLLGDLRPGQCTKLKVLLLMSLYNVSINLKGLKYISESPGFIPLLWWLLSDPDTEVCLHALRLVQSVVLEPEVFSKSASEFRSSLPLQRIVAMAKSRNPHLQTVAQELLEDLRALERDA